MTPTTQLDLSYPALVIIDVQYAIDDPRWGRRNNPNAENNIQRLLTHWRQRGRPVIHVRHDSLEPQSSYRPGHPGHAFKREVAPRPDEPIVAKQTNSAFIGTDLAARLDRSGCDAVVYAGVLTHNSVEATVRMSGNLGYRSLVVADATASVETVDLRGVRWDAEDVHALSLAHMSGEYARVVSTEDLLRLA